MTLDKAAGKWAIWCTVAAITATLIHITVHFFPEWDRCFRTCLGITAAWTICFCGLLKAVKKTPIRFRKRFQGIFDNGHPWIGLFGAWCVLLHIKFKVPQFLTTSTTLLTVYVIAIIAGVFNFYYHNLQVIFKDARGSPKKEMAGLLLRWGKIIADSMHYGFHFSLYFLLFFHVHMYFIYNVKGFF